MTYQKDKLERFAFRLDEETAKFLKEDSAALGMSSSAYLRMLVLQRRANLAVTRDIQQKSAAQTQAALAQVADKASEQAQTIVREFADKLLTQLSSADADKAPEILKSFAADKADNPNHENK